MVSVPTKELRRSLSQALLAAWQDDLVAMTVSEGQLTVSCRSSRGFARSSIGLDDKDINYHARVPAGRIIRILDNLNQESVALELGDKAVVIHAPRIGKFSIPTSADDIPLGAEQSSEDGAIVELELSSILDALSLVEKCALASGKSRPGLHGVLFDVGEDRLRLAATNGVALGVVDSRLVSKNGGFLGKVFLSLPEVRVLKKAISDCAKEPRFKFSSSLVGIFTDDTEIFIRSSMFAFPKFEDILERAKSLFFIAFSVSLPDLSNGLRLMRLSLAAVDKKQTKKKEAKVTPLETAITARIDSGRLLLSGEDQILGAEAKVDLPLLSVEKADSCSFVIGIDLMDEILRLFPAGVAQFYLNKSGHLLLTWQGKDGFYFLQAVKAMDS